MYNNTNQSKLKVCSKCKWELPANNTYFCVSNKAKSGLKSQCKQCELEYRMKTRDKKKEYDEQYRNERREYIRKRQAEYAKKHKERKRAYDKQRRNGPKRQEILEKKKIYYEENKAIINKKHKMYVIKNKDDITEYRKKYYLKNKSRKQLQSAKWRKNNREQDRILKQRYKARKKKLDDNFTDKQWEECKKHFNYECAYCGSKEPLAQEHFIPVSNGGEYTKNNIIPSCKSCNSSKWNSDFFDWYPKHKHYSKQRESKILDYLNYESNKTQQLALL